MSEIRTRNEELAFLRAQRKEINARIRELTDEQPTSLKGRAELVGKGWKETKQKVFERYLKLEDDFLKELNEKWKPQLDEIDAHARAIEKLAKEISCWEENREIKTPWGSYVSLEIANPQDYRHAAQLKIVADGENNLRRVSAATRFMKDLRGRVVSEKLTPEEVDKAIEDLEV